MAPYADIQSVIDYDDITSNLYTEKKSYPLHYQSTVRKVSFSKVVREYDIERASDYSDEEREATWHSVQQLRQLKQKAKNTIRQMEQGRIDANDDNWTSRGLQCKTTAASQQRYQARTTSWAAVFLEQDQQEIKGINDPQFLAEVYSEHTAVSQCLAEFRGKQDAKAARE